MMRNRNVLLILVCFTITNSVDTSLSAKYGQLFIDGKINSKISTRAGREGLGDLL